ncbi:MAG: plasmid stabilization protein [Candidatus Brocadia carolinensis]|uniref:Plasmid stabilization protein n=1 Tax=Candidatus Brocadia carolinensis TaxID=1004156 RepID=A0A1V4APS3_9BACT|nr:MAG: plasmid stabilization protein [Candidatus Brocadia caroliniensis]
MSDKYEVIWSYVAENDLRNIIEYIARDSPGNASKVFKKIRQKASNLHILPERGRIVQELRDQGILPYRELIISPWRVIYRISGKNVYVLSILDSRQNIEDILLERLLNSKL